MRSLLLAGACAALALPAAADDLLVPEQFPTIQAALDAAADFDRVLVESGDWSGPFDLRGKPVVLESVHGPGFTRLLGHGGPIVRTADGDTPGAELRGFALVGGGGVASAPGAPRDGGALHVRDAWLRVVDCLFWVNHVDGDGGAVFVETHGQQVRLEACMFGGNSAGGQGGGVALRALAPGAPHEVRRCTFRQNTAGGDGGGLHSLAPDVALVTDTAFLHNTSAGDGGGLAGTARTRLPTRNVFEGNHAAARGGALFLRVDVPEGASVALLGGHDRVVGNSAGGDGGGFAFALTAPRHPGVTLTDAVFADNQAAGRGGAWHLDVAHAGPGAPAPLGVVTLATRCTLAGNRATLGGDAVSAQHAFAQRVALRELILASPGPAPFAGTPAAVSASLVEGGLPGPGNFSADPQFLEPEQHVFALRSTSPARGAASDGGDLGGLPYSPWADHGHAHHGTSGRATLRGEGTPLPGQTVTLVGEHIKASGQTSLVMGAFAVYVPFKKGIVVPFPHIVTPYSVAAPDGTKAIDFVWPADVPEEAPIYAQFFTIDPASASEIASTNAVSATRPSQP